MPTIDQYHPDQVRTAPLAAPLQNPNVITPDYYGASIAQGADKLGRSIAEVQYQQREREVIATSTDYMNRLAKRENDILYNEKNGVMLRQGQNAEQAPEDYDNEYAKAVDELAGEITDNDSRNAFLKAAGHRQVASRARVQSRSSNVMQDYRLTQQEAGINRVRDDALVILSDAVDRGNHAEITAAVAGVSQSVRSQNARRALVESARGTDPETTALKAQADTSATYGAAIDLMLSRNQYEMADEFYKTHAAELSPKARDHYQAKVADGIDRAFISETSLKIGTERDESGNFLNENEIRERAQAATADRPELTADVTTRAIAERNRTIQAVAQEREETYDTAYRKIMNGTSYENAVSYEQERFMTPQQVDALRSRAGVGKTHATTKTIQNVQQTDVLRSMIDAGKVKDKSGAILSVSEEMIYSEAMARGLTAEQYESLTEYMEAKKNPDALSITDVNRAMVANGLGKYEESSKKYPDLFSQVQAMMPKGKKATDQDIMSAVSKLFASGEIKGGGAGYGSDMTYIEAKKRGRDSDWLPDLSEQEEKAIQYIFDSRNLPSDPQNNIIQRRAKKYLTDGMPTPIGDDGLPMSVTEAIYTSTIFDERLAKPKSTPPKKEQTYQPTENQQFQPYRYLMDLNKK